MVAHPRPRIDLVHTKEGHYTAVSPNYFVQLLVYMLAWHLAEPVTDQITKAEYWRGVALGSLTENGRGGYFRQACNIDGRGKPNYAIVDFPLTDVR